MGSSLEMRQRIKHAFARVGNLMTGRDTALEHQGQIADQVRQIFTLVAHIARDSALADPRNRDPRRLLGYGYKGYSQGDEDGIIDEIFRRIGTTDRSFVEFGVGNGLQNNTAALLLAGWRGDWLEGSAEDVAHIEAMFAPQLARGELRVRRTFITAENIETLFTEAGVPTEPDLLSIDIDGNDYWVWRAISRYRPRVVVVEYNAKFGRSARCVVPYRPDRVWDGTSHFGASLAALEALGREKGYALVGCGYQGTNAFFVRDDLLGDHFCAPYTAANHYEPARYALAWLASGHPAAWGELEQV
jgi:hypothetical protein